MANDCAKLSVCHCEFGQTDRSEQTLSSSQSDVTLTGCYFHGLAFDYERSAQAVALTCKSVANVSNNYFFRTGNGISVLDADLICMDNLVSHCRQLASAPCKTLGLFTGLCIKSRGNKVQVLANVIRNCDVGIYIGQASAPIVKDNTIDNSVFSGVFAECESKPSLVGNSFNGGGKKLNVGGGLGILLISKSAGLIGKNQLADYQVSPIMIFSTCHPLLKDNAFDSIDIDEDKQKHVEKQMLDQFQADLFKNDEYFYIIDNELTEKEMQEVILEKKCKT